MLIGIVRTKGKKFFRYDSLKEKNGYWNYGIIVNFLPKVLGFCVWISRW